MSSQPSWRPNLPESRLFDEKTLLQGAILSAVAYGVNLALFILIIPLLITNLKVDIKHNGRVSRLTICLLIYVCVMFILSTLSVAAEAETTQLLFIENRDFPGGPAAFQEAMAWTPISYLASYCFVWMNWFADSLLLWRCWVIYRSSRTSLWLAMAIPGLMLLASFVTGTIFLAEISRVSSSGSRLSKFELIYSTVTLGLNVVLTLMIVIRLYLHRRRFTKLLGRCHATSHYTSIISMLIESAAALVVMAIWLLIAFSMDNSSENIPKYSVIQVQAAASYMIIFKVARGTAWTSKNADSKFTVPASMPEYQKAHSNIRFQTASVEHPVVDSPVTSRSRNQIPLDGPYHGDVLDIKSNSRDSDTICESSPGDPAVPSSEKGLHEIC